MRLKEEILKLIFSLLLIAITFGISSAEVPGTINLEGSVAELGLLNDERVVIMLSLYDSRTANTALWTQKQIAEINNGKFSIMLNSFPEYVFQDTRYYFGVELRTEKESICLGRKRLASVVDL